MKYSKVNTLPLGLYKVYWKYGGCSLCSIGQNRDGDRWIAPTNWSSAVVVNRETAKSIKRVEVVMLHKWRMDL